MAHGSAPNYSPRARYNMYLYMYALVSGLLQILLTFKEHLLHIFLTLKNNNFPPRYAQFLKYQKAVPLDSKRGQSRQKAIAKQVQVHCKPGVYIDLSPGTCTFTCTTSVCEVVCNVQVCVGIMYVQLIWVIFFVYVCTWYYVFPTYMYMYTCFPTYMYMYMCHMQSDLFCV